jgi:hypothetical protein
MEDLDPLFMTNKNLGIRKTPQTVMEFPFDKSQKLYFIHGGAASGFNRKSKHAAPFFY